MSNPLPPRFKVKSKKPTDDEWLDFYRGSGEKFSFGSFYDALLHGYEKYEDVGFEIWQVNLMLAEMVYEYGPKTTST